MKKANAPQTAANSFAAQSQSANNTGSSQIAEQSSASGVQIQPVTDIPAEKKDVGVAIKSPIVGTFYRSPSPDAPPYVDVGKTVKKGQPLCILEAMKMMNTLEAEFDCVVEKVLVSNGDLVEFDQPLFMVRTL